MTRVLVVDDDKLVRRVVVAALTRDGYEVVACATVAEALASLEGVAIVVTDLKLGEGGDGRDLIKRLAGRVPVVVLSGSVNLAKQRFDGAAAVLSKPFRQAELLATIRELA